MNFNIISFATRIKKRLPSIASGLLTAILVWQVAFFSMSTDAIAAPLNVYNPSITVAGLFNQTEGKIQEAVGTVQRNVGKVTGQAEGVGKQIQGRAKQDLGKVEKALPNAKKAVEKRAEKDLDKTQNALEDAAENVKKTTGEVVDNVKEMFGK